MKHGTKQRLVWGMSAVLVMGVAGMWALARKPGGDDRSRAAVVPAIGKVPRPAPSTTEIEVNKRTLPEPERRKVIKKDRPRRGGERTKKKEIHPHR